MLYGLDLFSGIGGITLALQPWVRPIVYCEIEPYCQSVLLSRMQEGNLPKAPIWDDIRTLRSETFPAIDIIYGGFPCQDISVAGCQKGLEGERSGLIFEVLRLLDEKKAPFLFLENVPNIRTKGAERICKELAERGYDCRWCNISAADVGALHKRERWFLLAHSRFSSERSEDKSEWPPIQATGCSKNVPDTECEGLERQCKSERIQKTYADIGNSCYWSVEPDVGRVVNGLPHRVDRIKALGNSVVPLQVREAFKILMGIK